MLISSVFYLVLVAVKSILGQDKKEVPTRVCHDIKKSKPRRGPMVSSCTLLLFVYYNFLSFLNQKQLNY